MQTPLAVRPLRLCLQVPTIINTGVKLQVCFPVQFVPALTAMEQQRFTLVGVKSGCDHRPRWWQFTARIFFPRVRTPCGHGAQVIVEGREEQSDGGERNKDPKPTQTKHQSPQAETPPSCSLSSTLGETCETETSGN